MDVTDSALQAAKHVYTLCVFRMLPFVGYVLLAPRFNRAQKVVCGLLAAAAVVFAIAFRGAAMVAWYVAGLLFYTLCATGIPAVARALRSASINHLVLFGLLAVAYLFVPVALLGTATAGVFLVLGWEMLLCSYSFCREVAQQDQDPGLGESVFFLLVDPTLTFHARSHAEKAPGRSRSALPRIALGASSMFVAAALLRPGYKWLASDDGFQVVGARLGAFALVAFGLLRLLTEYAVHSGLASIQIGMMRQVGYSAPERYNYPLLARGPFDFWRRWNTYMAAWLKRYVFTPNARWLTHTLGVRGGTALALLATVVASGLLHDGYGFAAHHVLSTRYIEFFLATGLAMLLWAATARVGRALLGTGLRTAAWPVVLSRAAFLSALVAASAAWG